MSKEKEPVKFNIKVTEVLERNVEVYAMTAEEAVANVQERYDNEDIVLDYNDHISTDILPELPVSIILSDVKDGTVKVYHLQKVPDDIELWLSETYKDYDSNCYYMVTKKEVEHEYCY